MSVTDAAVRPESGSESIVELVDGLAVVVLTILGLAEVTPTFLVSNSGMRMQIPAAIPANADPTLARIIRNVTTDTTGLQTMAGLAAIVLDILALSLFAPTKPVLPMPSRQGVPTGSGAQVAA